MQQSTLVVLSARAVAAIGIGASVDVGVVFDVASVRSVAPVSIGAAVGVNVPANIAVAGAALIEIATIKKKDKAAVEVSVW